MSDFRPICDVWLLARPKVAYYGAYPSGFLERARALLGVSYDDPVLHVCSGKIRDYPFRGFGQNDKTLDLDPELKPDFVMDARAIEATKDGATPHSRIGMAGMWPAVLADPPYSAEDAKHYRVGPEVLPARAELLRRCLSIVRPGGRVGFLDFVAPRPPKKGVRLVALVAILVGYGNAARMFSVYERATANDAQERARALAAVRGKRIPEGEAQAGSRECASPLPAPFEPAGGPP